MQTYLPKDEVWNSYLRFSVMKGTRVQCGGGGGVGHVSVVKEEDENSPLVDKLRK